MPQTGTIEFWNTSEYDASVYKLDANGKEIHVVDLGPDESSTQPTSAGEKWVVKNKETGEKVGSVVGTDDRQLYKIRIKTGGGKEGPKQSGSGS